MKNTKVVILALALTLACSFPASAKKPDTGFEDYVCYYSPTWMLWVCEVVKPTPRKK